MSRYSIVTMLCGLLATSSAASVGTYASIYPPEYIVWLRLHDCQATLPEAMLKLQAILTDEALADCRRSSTSMPRPAWAECKALYTALTEIDYFAKLGVFGDWSFIMPIHELRDWYAMVVLHEQLQRVQRDNNTMAAVLLHAVFESYACKLSNTTPPYIIINDRKKLIEVLRGLVLD